MLFRAIRIRKPFDLSVDIVLCKDHRFPKVELFLPRNTCLVYELSLGLAQLAILA